MFLYYSQNVNKGLKFQFRMVFLVLVFTLFCSNAIADESNNKQLILSGLVAAAKERTQHQVNYDGSYYSIAYPNGDVPSHLGVCTDVVIRSYRGVGIDLQKAVHEDMVENFSSYPSKRIWGLKRPDKNIDHRRVPNLQAFFKKYGEVLPLSLQADDYVPGDLVTWMLPGNLPHIGIVSDMKSADGKRWLIVHNIGAGTQLQDMLFSYKITGHYRYFGL